MNRTIRSMLLVVAISSLSRPAVGQTTQAKQAAPKTTQPDFQAMIRQYYAAWNTGDPAKAAPLYAKDADLVFYDMTPLKYNGWTEYDAGVRKVLDTFASATFAPQPDLRVTRHGSVAWTTETWHMSGKKKTGEAVEMDGRHTTIWENRAGKWLIVHEHFSVPLQ